MSSPIDIIASHLASAAEGRYTQPPTWVATEAASALTDDRIVAHAVAAVRNHSWTAPDVEDLSDRDLAVVLRVAFGSITKEGS